MPQKPPTFSAAPCTDSNILGSLSWLYSSALLSVEMCHRSKVNAKKLHTQYEISRFSEEKGILAFIILLYIYIYICLSEHTIKLPLAFYVRNTDEKKVGIGMSPIGLTEKPTDL